MSKVIRIGCNLHLRSMLLMYCVGEAAPQQASYNNDRSGKDKMLAILKQLAGQHGADFSQPASESR